MANYAASVRRVFLADDDEEDRLMFQEALAETFSDVEIVHSFDGQELMDNLENRVPPLPEIIFLDLNMPRKNGFECLLAIKERSEYKNIPVVIFTTTIQTDTVRQTYASGADCFFSKPSSYQQLKRGLSALLTKDWQAVTARPSMQEFVFNAP